jgi:hypothetical protein
MPQIGTSGPEDFSIQQARWWVKDHELVSDGEVVQVDPGVNILIRSYHVINNAECGIFPLNGWETCFTVKNITDNIPVGAESNPADGEVGDGDSMVNVGKITKPTQFRLRVWANQDLGAAPPPSSAW